MRTLASISAAVFFFLAPACFTQFLRVDGKEIVDATGQPVLLRGIGLGGWLVPEGYMLHTPGYGSPTSIRNMMQDLIGEQETETFFEYYRANYVAEKDIEKIAAWGFNSIRLPFHYELLSPQNQPGVFLEEGFLLLDSLITWSKRQGLYVILDMHCAPGGQNSNNISDSDGEAKLWTVPANQDRTVEIWKKIAERYSGEAWVAGYDLLNEPVMPVGYNNLDLRNFYRRLALAIREVDNNHILFIEGNNFATDFRDLTPPLLYGSNIVYSFHKYWNETTQATIQDYLNLRNNWNVPLWMGESGENSNPWFYETIKLLEANNIGWCWWTHKKIQTTTSPLSAPITPDYQRVLDYWNGNASRPAQAFARDALSPPPRWKNASRVRMFCVRFLMLISMCAASLLRRTVFPALSPGPSTTSETPGSPIMIKITKKCVGMPINPGIRAVNSATMAWTSRKAVMRKAQPTTLAGLPAANG